MMQLKDSIAETVNLKMGNTNNLHPAFCFRYTHKNFNFKNLNNDTYGMFLDKIDLLSQLTWQNICQINRYKNGTEKITRSEIKQQIDKCITEDREIIVFHLVGKFRIIGCREGKIFYVLFIDVNGEVYKH